MSAGVRVGAATVERMARSHAQVLLHETFGLVEPDADGDLGVCVGAIMVYVTVVGRGRGVKVWTVPVVDMPMKRAPLTEVSAANSRAVFSRTYAVDGRVAVEGCLPLGSISARELVHLVEEVGTIAESLALLIPPVHGGHGFLLPADDPAPGRER